MAKNPRKVAIVIVLSGVALGCVACGIGGYLLYARFWNVASVAARAEKAEAAYRATGMPWVADDLNPHPPVTDAENAAIPFHAAMAAMKGHPFGSIGVPLNEAARTGNVAEVKRLLRPYDQVLAKVIEASRRPRMDFHRDWDENVNLLFPELAEFKSFDKMLVARAQSEAYEKKDDACLADLTAAQSLNRLLCGEPYLIGMLVQISCEAILEQALERCAYFMRNRRAAIGELVSLMKAPPSADLSTAMRCEAYLGIAVVRNLKASQIRQLSGDVQRLASGGSQSGSSPDPPLVRSGLPSGQLERAWATIHMELWTKVAKILAESPRDPSRTSKEIGVLGNQIDNDKSVTNLLELIIFPVYSPAIEATVKQQAHQRTLSALLMAMEIKSRTGKFPASLKDIPGTWVDPFTNSPLKYKLTPNGVRVYSVGPTLIDHGGVAQTEVPKDSKAYDIVASYPPVGPRNN